MRASSASRSVRRPTSTVGRTNSRVGIVALNGRPVRAITSRARTTRRPLFGSIASAAAGSTAAQLGEQGGDPLAVEPLLQGRPYVGVGRRDLEPVERRPHVEPRPARDHGHGAAGQHGVDVGPRVPLVGGDAGLLGHVEHVELVVRDAVPLLGRHLGGADVHPAVELRGVGADDLAAQPLRERDGEVGLAGGGRADDSDDETLHVSRCARPRASRRRGRTGRGPHPASTTGRAPPSRGPSRPCAPCATTCRRAGRRRGSR